MAREKEKQAQELHTKQYTIVISAQVAPMTFGEYVDETGKNPFEASAAVPNFKDPGYVVVNGNGEYKQWFPKAIFERDWRCTETYVDRMVLELDQLLDKIILVDIALRKKGFISECDKTDFEMQVECMWHYAMMLNARIQLSIANEGAEGEMERYFQSGTCEKYRAVSEEHPIE